MKTKILFALTAIAGVALCSAAPAAAQSVFSIRVGSGGYGYGNPYGYGGYGSPYGYGYGYSPYANQGYYQHQRDHEDLDDEHADAHDELDQLHAEAHEQGLTPQQHRRLHRYLERQHAYEHYLLDQEHAREHAEDGYYYPRY